MKSKEHEFAACIGLDWSDAKHDICLQVAGSETTELSVLEHLPERIDEWARALRKRFDGRSIAIALELFKGPVVSALRKYDFFVLFPINPATLAKYRETWTLSGAKDDPTDAELALEILTRHPNRLQRLQPQSAEMRMIEQLVESRRRLVDDQTRITNRLTSALKNYFPQVLQWFNDKDTQVFCDFLDRWPTLKAAKHARRSTLQRFFNEHNVRHPGIAERRIDDIKSAVELTKDDGVIVPNALLVRGLVSQLRTTLKVIATFNDAIGARAQAHPDFRIFASFPAAGPVFAPRLLVAFGEQRERYPKPAELQMYAGIAPVTARSGKQCWVHWRWSCPSFLRQTFVEWAASTIPRSIWARAYYQHNRQKGKSHQAALRALAFKWLRILHRCWQSRTLYDESTYLSALAKRGSPLIESLAGATPGSIRTG